MLQRFVLTAAFCVLCGSAGDMFGQVRPAIITEATARRHGLHRDWLTQVRVNKLEDRVESVALYQPFPLAAPEGAAPAAGPGANPQGGPPPVVERGGVYLQTARGLIIAVDIGTGRSLWTTQVGRRDAPTVKPAVNKKFVAVINGTNLYLLDRYRGRLVWESRIDSVPLAGPAMSDNWVYVPTINGRIIAYDVKDPHHSWGATGFGRIDAPPIVTQDSLAWATNKGYLYLASKDRGEVSIQFETRRPVSAPVTYWPPNVYVASQDGYVYAISERHGESPWRYSAGSAIDEPPVAIEKWVYVSPESGSMRCVLAATGAQKWLAPGATRFVAKSPTRVYASDEFGALQILDAESGVRLDTMRIDRLDLPIANAQTDRIFVASKSGLLQCLHEISLKSPAYHEWPKADGPTGIKVQQGPNAGGEPPAAQGADGGFGDFGN